MATRQKRPRGSVAAKPALNVKIDSAAKTKLDRIADALGITQGQALEEILRNADVDAHGRPDWYEGPLATDNELELPDYLSLAA